MIEDTEKKKKELTRGVGRQKRYEKDQKSTVLLKSKNGFFQVSNAI